MPFGTAIPNLLTAARLALLGPILAALAVGTPAARWTAFALFMIAGVTDLLDGWAARRLGCASPVGVFLDPLVDKVLGNVLLVYLAVHEPRWVNVWLVMALLAREFAVQGFRGLAPCKGVVIRTGAVSKLKFVFETVTVGIVLAGLPLRQPGALPALAFASLLLAVAAGYVSMATILWRNRDLWKRPTVTLGRR